MARPGTRWQHCVAVLVRGFREPGKWFNSCPAVNLKLTNCVDAFSRQTSVPVSYSILRFMAEANSVSERIAMGGTAAKAENQVGHGRCNVVLGISGWKDEVELKM